MIRTLRWLLAIKLIYWAILLVEREGSRNLGAHFRQLIDAFRDEVPRG